MCVCVCFVAGFVQHGQHGQACHWRGFRCFGNAGADFWQLALAKVPAVQFLFCSLLNLDHDTYRESVNPIRARLPCFDEVVIEVFSPSLDMGDYLFKGTPQNWLRFCFWFPFDTNQKVPSKKEDAPTLRVSKGPGSGFSIGGNGGPGGLHWGHDPPGISYCGLVGNPTTELLRLIEISGPLASTKPIFQAAFGFRPWHFPGAPQVAALRDAPRRPRSAQGVSLAEGLAPPGRVSDLTLVAWTILDRKPKFLGCFLGCLTLILVVNRKMGVAFVGPILVVNRKLGFSCWAHFSGK